MNTITSYDEDAMLDVRDMQEEIREARESVPKARTFPDVLNEWTEAVLVENRKADLPALAAIFRLGNLGQRLIYEANAIGMNDTVDALRNRRLEEEKLVANTRAALALADAPTTGEVNNE